MKIYSTLNSIKEASCSGLVNFLIPKIDGEMCTTKWVFLSVLWILLVTICTVLFGTINCWWGDTTWINQRYLSFSTQIWYNCPLVFTKGPEIIYVLLYGLVESSRNSHISIFLSLSICPPLPPSILNSGWSCYNTREESKVSLGSIPMV